MYHFWGRYQHSFKKNKGWYVQYFCSDATDDVLDIYNNVHGRQCTETDTFIVNVTKMNHLRVLHCIVMFWYCLIMITQMWPYGWMRDRWVLADRYRSVAVMCSLSSAGIGECLLIGQKADSSRPRSYRPESALMPSSVSDVSVRPSWYYNCSYCDV